MECHFPDSRREARDRSISSAPFPVAPPGPLRQRVAMFSGPVPLQARSRRNKPIPLQTSREEEKGFRERSARRAGPHSSQRLFQFWSRGISGSFETSPAQGSIRSTLGPTCPGYRRVSNSRRLPGRSRSPAQHNPGLTGSPPGQQGRLDHSRRNLPRRSPERPRRIRTRRRRTSPLQQLPRRTSPHRSARRSTHHTSHPLCASRRVAIDRPPKTT